MYKLILFDFDGTIADTIELGVPIFNELAKKHNFLGIKNIDELRNVTLREFFKNHEVPKLKFPFYFKEFLKELHKQIDKVQVYDEMDDVVKKLNKNYKLGIVSSNSKENIKKFLKINDLEFCFDFVYNYSLLFGKAQIFKKIMRLKKLDKKDLVYIGDELRDIEASKKAGIDIISVTWGFNNKEILMKKNPTFIADKPKDILKFLEQ